MPVVLPFSPEWFDEVGHDSDPGPERDFSELLEAVDALPNLDRQIIESVFFEQNTKRGTARLLGISRAELDRRLKRALKTLTRPVGHRCRKRTKWGQCQQRVRGAAKLCHYHRRPDASTDEYYHRKVVLGLVTLIEDVLTDVEILTTMEGRRHEDGRRLDQYVLD